MAWETVVNKKFVIIGGNFLQNYRYFDNEKQSIREIFKCSIEICGAMNNYSAYLFGYLASHDKIQIFVNSIFINFNRLFLCNNFLIRHFCCEF